jgi:hypothetical protein
MAIILIQLNILGEHFLCVIVSGSGVCPNSIDFKFVYPHLSSVRMCTLVGSDSTLSPLNSLAVVTDSHVSRSASAGSKKMTGGRYSSCDRVRRHSDSVNGM